MRAELPEVLSRRDAATAAQGDAVLHVVGRVTAPVQSFLAPMTHGLLEAGVPQVVVMLDAPESRDQLAHFASGVNVVRVPMETRGWRHWRALRAAVQAELETQPFSAVHFHGLRPWMLAARLARRRDAGTAVYVSPHGSRLMWLLRWLATPGSRERQPGYIASSLPDSSFMSASGLDAQLLEGTVSNAFFEVRRAEAPQPLVVAGNHREVRADIALASQMAVLLGWAELGLAVHWFGPTGQASQARLAAAQVATFGALPDAELAARLAAGWVFVAPGGDAHFPVRLAQAMAAGVACIASDTPMHRAMLEHERTGLLYRDEAEALAQLTRLVDDAALRHRLGDAARRQARERFSVARFRDLLLPIYRPAGRVR